LGTLGAVGALGALGAVGALGALDRLDAVDVAFTQLAVKFAFVVPWIDPVNSMKLDRSSRFVRTASMLTAPERGDRWIVNPAVICKSVLLTFVMAIHLFEKLTVSLLVS
jgi:hypothetical protein